MITDLALYKEIWTEINWIWYMCYNRHYSNSANTILLCNSIQSLYFLSMKQWVSIFTLVLFVSGSGQKTQEKLILKTRFFKQVKFLKLITFLQDFLYNKCSLQENANLILGKSLNNLSWVGNRLKYFYSRLTHTTGRNDLIRRRWSVFHMEVWHSYLAVGLFWALWEHLF